MTERCEMCEGCLYANGCVACLLSQDDFCPGQQETKEEQEKPPINFKAVETD